MEALARLREENEILQERVRQLEDALMPKVNPPDGCHLSPSELAIYRHLHLGRVASREQLNFLLYSHRRDEPESFHIVDVFVARLRRKLVSHGITIENVWGQGWKMVRHQVEVA